MPRRRRLIKSNTCYEICFRARQTLPLVAYRVINLMIASAIARTQRDDKVILCHDIWNGSHPHLIIVAKDSQNCVNFYSEIQKKITDALKRLLDLSHLEIWEGYPMLAEIADLAKAKERVAYLYSNPGLDDLEENIERFPGLSSWREFHKSFTKLDAVTKQAYPWIRLPSIPNIRTQQLSARQDSNLVRLLRKRNKASHILCREPNAWMRCFGIDCDAEAEDINKEIIDLIRFNESEARRIREREGKQVMGKAKLCSQPILKPHKPKKQERKVFILTSINQLRIQLIEEFKEFCALCKECYRSWLKGDFCVEWPPGAFKPPIPPQMNVLPL